MVEDRLLTTTEAGKFFGVTGVTFNRWIKEGRINCIRTFGGRKRISMSEVKRIGKELAMTKTL